jgi:predicted nucleic acid-binding protein
LPTAALLEYLVGVNPGRRALVANDLRAAVELHPFGEPEADVAVQLYDELSARGQRLGWPDLQIAATALHLGEALVSNDKAFRAVPRLDVLSF